MNIDEENVIKFIPLSKNWTQLLKNLGLNNAPHNCRRVQDIVHNHNIDVSHFTGKYTKSKLDKIPEETFQQYVNESKSIAKLLRLCGLPVGGGSRTAIKKKLLKDNINISHFSGQGWSSGLTKDTDDRVKACADKQRLYNDDDYLVESAPYWMSSGWYLKPIMIRKGIPYTCAECNMLPEWNSKPLTLHVDHISGVRSDNRLQNLRFLCPNCHQQTETWGSKNTDNHHK